MYDCIVIGGGHNGLVAASYLASSGLRVVVLERRGCVGGAALSEEFHAGYRNSVFSYVVSLLDSEIIADMRLSAHGLEIIDRPSGSLSLLLDADGRHDYCWFARDMSVAEAEIGKFSRVDAAAYALFHAELEAIAPLIKQFSRRLPLDLGFAVRDWRKVIATLRAGGQIWRLSLEERRLLQELLTSSVGDYLDRRFESDVVKGNYGFEGIIGNFASLYESGSAYVLLHHAVGAVNGKLGAWGYAKGGMGAITQCMQKQCIAQGVTILTDSEVSQVLVEDGCARGVRLQNGESLFAKHILSNVGPKPLFTQLVEPVHVSAEFYRRMQAWRCASGTFRMNLALQALPTFAALKDQANPALLMNGTINIAPSPQYLEQAFMDAKIGTFAKQPVISACIPSLLDDSLTDKQDQHVMSLFCQHFNPDPVGGEDWDDLRQTAAESIIACLAEHAPGLRDLIVGMQINSPKDIEKQLNMAGGDIFHGRLQPDQLYNFRPAAGYSDYRMPIKNLYLCGSGAHPGGGVSGLPGRNAALAVIKAL